MAWAEASGSRAPLREPLTIDALRALPVFCALSESSLELVCSVMSVAPFPAGSLLIREGVAPTALHVPIRGLFQLLAGSGDDEITLAILSPPALLFSEAVVCEAVPAVSARVLQASFVGAIPLEHARRLFKERRDFADLIARDLAAGWRNILLECRSARTRNSLRRLLAWTIAMLDRAEDPHQIKLPFGKAMLAARLGVAAATLSRDLARLASLGVTVESRTLIIEDAERLREAAAVESLSTPPVP